MSIQKVETLVVKFPLNNRKYHFKSTLQDVRIGDEVIVDCANGLQKVKVVEVIHNGVTAQSKAWAIAKVDNRQAIRTELQNQRIIIQERMRGRLRELSEETVFAYLARQDSTMACLRAEYNQINHQLSELK